MDCLKSFSFTLAQQANYTVPNGFKNWVLGAQHFWLFETNGTSTYNIQGFKNINIFKIEITGDVYSAALPVGVSVIAQNWHLGLSIIGQNSQSVGFVTASPDDFAMTSPALNPAFLLSKFQKSISFESPIQSATTINVNRFYADGIANESLISGQIGYGFVVTVFYKYEGE